MAKMTFRYWEGRGKGESARMMFFYAGVEFVDKRYDGHAGPDGRYPEWTKDKETMATDFAFPNLPYLIDGEVRLTESWCIYRYLARKFGLYPLTEKGETECDMIAGVLEDLQEHFEPVVYNPDIKNLVGQLKKLQMIKLGQINRFLAGRQFVTGDKLTYADFVLYEKMCFHRLLLPDIFDNLPNISAFLDRFESLERIDAYIKSPTYKKYPCFGPDAAWGGETYDNRTW